MGSGRDPPGATTALVVTTLRARDEGRAAAAVTLACVRIIADRLGYGAFGAVNVAGVVARQYCTVRTLWRGGGKPPGGKGTGWRYAERGRGRGGTKESAFPSQKCDRINTQNSGQESPPFLDAQRRFARRSALRGMGRRRVGGGGNQRDSIKVCRGENRAV